MRITIRFAVVTLLALAATPLTAQQGETAPTPIARFEVRPERVEIQAGQRQPISIVAFDASGAEIADPAFRVAAPRGVLDFDRDDEGRTTLEATTAGDYEVVITAVATAGALPVSVTIPVSVDWADVAVIEITPEPGVLYVGTSLRHDAQARHADGSLRPEPTFAWSSSDPDVASVDRFGTVTAHEPGSVTITAELNGADGSVRYDVAPFTVERLEITGGLAQAKTGDVLEFDARALTATGTAVDDVPVTWAYTFVPDDSIVAPGAAAVVKDGRFVAEQPGHYTILAMAGGLTARRTVDVSPRHVVQRVELIGHGSVREKHTSDLWVFEGVDGRDYAVTGTWGADGKAYFWDVTDPANIVRIDSIQVDARTVNDVKVSPDGRYAALSREGASNRRNGVVIVDLSNPRNPEIASVFDDGLTGGVHNMFATNDHLFALSAGDKYVILDVTDIHNPRYVSEYNHPGSRIHDVWVQDGIAYSSEWGNGVVIVDVGNGRWGGSLENPVFVTNIPYPVGRTHAAFPYHQEETGKFYLFLGDEILNRSGLALEGGLSVAPYDPATGQGGVPSTSAGYIHVIDWTDPDNPKDVARYHVPEFGTHNIWVENDKLYVAYYEGGLRVVDVSGELMGNLAEQGREIAVYKAHDPVGYIPNAPMTWGPQPYKGHVFFSDFNSGLWAVRLEPRARPTT
ncbi:MAG: Ig-like domain-containing protein [Longimicrobiales bacterium]